MKFASQILLIFFGLMVFAFSNGILHTLNKGESYIFLFVLACSCLCYNALKKLSNFSELSILISSIQLGFILFQLFYVVVLKIGFFEFGASIFLFIWYIFFSNMFSSISIFLYHASIVIMNIPLLINYGGNASIGMIILLFLSRILLCFLVLFNAYKIFKDQYDINNKNILFNNFSIENIKDVINLSFLLSFIGFVLLYLSLRDSERNDVDLLLVLPIFIFVSFIYMYSIRYLICSIHSLGWKRLSLIVYFVGLLSGWFYFDQYYLENNSYYDDYYIPFSFIFGGGILSLVLYSIFLKSYDWIKSGFGVE